VSDLKSQKATGDEQLAQVQSRINQRLQVLGERERALANYENKVRAAAWDLAQLQQEEASLLPKLNAMKLQLGQADVELAARQREADDSLNRFAKAKQALEDLRLLVAQ
jgi:chromosome segregation ATPase